MACLVAQGVRFVDGPTRPDGRNQGHGPRPRGYVELRTAESLREKHRRTGAGLRRELDTANFRELRNGEVQHSPGPDDPGPPDTTLDHK